MVNVLVPPLAWNWLQLEFVDVWFALVMVVAEEWEAVDGEEENDVSGSFICCNRCKSLVASSCNGNEEEGEEVGAMLFKGVAMVARPFTVGGTQEEEGDGGGSA